MALSDLASERFISLTTFRRDGTAAATPVWVVSDDGRRLLVWTGADTWKAKRLRRDDRVRVAACNARGSVRGEHSDGRARFLPEGDAELVQQLLRRKYKVKALLDAFNAVNRAIRRKPRAQAAYIEIVPR